MRLGQQERGVAVCQLIPQALRGVFRVKGHITRPRFQNAIHANNHVRAAVGTNGHAVIGAHARGNQVMGQLVGTPVQFGITELNILPDQRNGIRLAICLLLKQLVNQLILRARQGGMVKIHQ
ncbi:hypothetical protein Xsze_03727 [Xenorhabdus szentirmaii DSM 16338]|nr:hypothetical protein Xsze_03727 [Xenorhabdus szentirmaii DSM 16338]